MFQGFLAGLWFMVGFQLGFAVRGLWRVLAGKLAGKLAEPWKTVPRKNPRNAAVIPVAVAIGLLAYVIGYGALVVSWQNRVRELVEMEPVDGAGHAAFLVSMFATMAVFYGIARGIGALRALAGRSVVRRGGSGRRARWVSRATGLVAVLALVAGLTGAGLAAVGRIYADRDAATLAGSVRPVVAGRSGGPGSVVDWDGLGRQGRAFAGGGPSAAQIARVTGTPALEPVRVYAGLSQGADARERAALVVEELVRTGAFERDVLLVATPTGSGWLEPQAIASLEYLYGGNTATASMQYSLTQRHPRSHLGAATRPRPGVPPRDGRSSCAWVSAAGPPMPAR